MTEADDYDGCGISPLSTGKDDPFYAACQWHDGAYTEGSKQQQMFTRSQVDYIFYLHCKIIANGNKLLLAKAYLYYTLARLFGARFWEGLSERKEAIEE